LGDYIDKFKLLHPGEEPLIVFLSASQREFRKTMVATLVKNANASPFSVNSFTIIPESKFIEGGFGDTGLLRSMSALRQLRPAAGHNLIGTLIVLRLHELETTPLKNTFVCTKIFDADEAEPDTVLSCQRLPLTKAFWTPAREAALLEFDELTLRLGQLDVSMREWSDLCAVCHLAAYPLIKPELPMQKCARCRMVWYCGEDHQREHWPVHKPHCKELCGLRARKKELMSIIHAPLNNI
jgi:hypothetical protein